MNTKSSTIAGMVCVAAIAVVQATLGASGGGEDLRAALDTAIDDERRAHAFYAAIIAEHGEQRPFSNIINAEQRHIAALLAQYERLGIEPPADAWREHDFGTLPGSVAEACDVAIVMEVRNGRIYDELIASVEDEQVRSTFERLRFASVEHHLPAFRRRGSGWAPVAADDLGDRQTRQRQVADQARDTMFASLLTELTASLANGPPSDAIRVCSERAPEIAKEVAAQEGVRIGRTSWKLRNPSNGPPVWADLALDDKPGKPAYFADRTGRLGVVTPIRLAGTCLQCHGAADDLAPGVRDALADLYPDDQATGFAVGDLRGWFWVEVPADHQAEVGRQ